MCGVCVHSVEGISYIRRRRPCRRPRRRRHRFGFIHNALYLIRLLMLL